MSCQVLGKGWRQEGHECHYKRQHKRSLWWWKCVSWPHQCPCPGYDIVTALQDVTTGGTGLRYRGSLCVLTSAYKFYNYHPQEFSKNVQWKTRFIWGRHKCQEQSNKEGSRCWEVKRCEEWWAEAEGRQSKKWRAGGDAACFWAEHMEVTVQRPVLWPDPSGLHCALPKRIHMSPRLQPTQ